MLAPAIEAGEIDVVVIHDAARPLAGTDMLADVIDAAARLGRGDPGRRPRPARVPRRRRPARPSAWWRCRPRRRSPPRPLLDAYRRAHVDGFVGTDTASCIERYADESVRCVPGDAGNIKITFPDDLFLAERLLAKARWDLSGGREPHRARRSPR